MSTNTLVDYLLESNVRGKTNLTDIVRVAAGKFKNAVSKNEFVKYFNTLAQAWKEGCNATGDSWFRDFMIQQSNQLQQQMAMQQMHDTTMINQQAASMNMDMGMGGMMCSTDIASSQKTTSVVTEIAKMDIVGNHEKDDRYYGVMGKIMIADHKKWEARYFNNWGHELRRYVEYSLSNNVPDRAELVKKYDIQLWHASDHSEYSKDSEGIYTCGDPIYVVKYYGVVQIVANNYRKGDKKARNDLERYSHFVYDGIKMMCGVIDGGPDYAGAWTRRFIVDDNPKYPYLSYINIEIEKSVPKEVLKICGAMTESTCYGELPSNTIPCLVDCLLHQLTNN